MSRHCGLPIPFISSEMIQITALRSSFLSTDSSVICSSDVGGFACHTVFVVESLSWTNFPSRHYGLKPWTTLNLGHPLRCVTVGRFEASSNRSSWTITEDDSDFDRRSLCWIPALEPGGDICVGEQVGTWQKYWRDHRTMMGSQPCTLAVAKLEKWTHCCQLKLLEKADNSPSTSYVWIYIKSNYAKFD